MQSPVVSQFNLCIILSIGARITKRERGHTKTMYSPVFTHIFSVILHCWGGASVVVVVVAAVLV